MYQLLLGVEWRTLGRDVGQTWPGGPHFSTKEMPAQGHAMTKTDQQLDATFRAYSSWGSAPMGSHALPPTNKHPL